MRGPIKQCAVALAGLLAALTLAAPAAASGTPVAHSAPAAPTSLVGGMSVGGLLDVNGTLYVRRGASEITAYRDGTATTTTPVTWRSVNSFAVDPTGDIYVARYPYDLLKLDPSGQVLWVRTVPKEITAVFGHQTPSGFVVGAVSGSAGTTLFTSDGNPAGSNPSLVGQEFAESPSGGLIAATGSYVVSYDAALHQSFYFGAAGSANSPPPGQFAFYQQGSALQLPDGRYLVADATRGIEVVSAQGLLQGIIPESYLGGLTQVPTMAIVNDRLYYANGPRFTSSQQVSSVPLADALASMQPPTVLGFGVGVAMPAGAYFPPGQQPTLTLAFDPWWSQLGKLGVQYSVIRTTSDASSSAKPATVSVTVTPSLVRSGVKLRLPAPDPGSYEIDLTLQAGKATVGSATLDYSAGAPGDQLNFSTLAGTGDAGGPDGPRGVALADVLGTGAHRIALSWSHLLDAQGHLTFGYYDGQIAAAAQQSATTGVPFSVQLTDGGAAWPYIRNGTWGSMVTQIVQHWKSQVHYWEPFNEPNDSFGSASSYVATMLKPTYDAVKAVDPTAQVIGGTVVGYDVNYWQQIIAAGGLADMDIAGIHPYPGYDMSFEEVDFASYITKLRSLFAAAGKPGLPIWVTELAWWSNGTVNPAGQADKSARALLWMKALGITHWEYFISQGTWTDNGQDFSAIYGNTWVKPAALALMAQRTQTQGRAVTGFQDTGIPDSYDLGFGPANSGGDTVQALWTDDLGVTAGLTSRTPTTVSVVDEYGRSSHLRLSAGLPALVHLSGSVIYLHVPSGVTVNVGPVESWGHDLALSSQGATASASSTNPASSARGAIDGDRSTDLGTGFPSGPAWVSAPGDTKPTLTVNLPRPETVDRVVLATTGIGSVLSGVRSYNVDVRTPDGSWLNVAAVRDSLFPRLVQTGFRPQLATGVRIDVLQVNYSGYTNGSKPAFWPTDSATLSAASQPWYGPAIIRELEVYGPGAIATAPQALTVKAKPRTASVTWRRPPGVSPKEYAVTIGHRTITSRRTTATMQRLRPHHHYTVHVVALNGAGASPRASRSMSTPRANRHRH